MKNVTPANQDYLETILRLSRKLDLVRAVDIANKMNVSRAGVTKAMSGLKADGYIEQEKYGCIKLTKAGREIAIEVEKRHILLKTFLSDILGVSNEASEEDACKMEHLLTTETIEKIKEFMINSKQNDE